MSVLFTKVSDVLSLESGEGENKTRGNYVKPSAGCKYCQAHTSHGAGRAGIEEKKIADILNYSESEKFSNSEKAALDLAFAAGKVPNNSNQEHFDNLSKYYSKKEIVDIVSVISLFGFLNRWNDTLGTALEEVPESFVNDKLKPLGWI